jgi:hypothetical protein
MVVRVIMFYALKYKLLTSDKTTLDIDRFLHYISARVEANNMVLSEYYVKSPVGNYKILPIIIHNYV